MATRRETRSETEAFMTRLKGRCLEERRRLATEHREFLIGVRDTDADFGPDTDPPAPPAPDAPPTESTVVASAPASSPSAAFARVPPAAAPAPTAAPRQAPVGKAASYLAAMAASKKKAKAPTGKGRTTTGKAKATTSKGKARAKPTGPPKPKKLTAKQQAAADKKAAKDAEVARVAAERAAAARSKQAAVVEAEKHGEREVQQARERLDAKKKEMDRKREEKKAETKRRRDEKRAAERERQRAEQPVTPSPKKTRRTSPHDDDDDGDAESLTMSDGESTPSSSTGADERAPCTPGPVFAPDLNVVDAEALNPEEFEVMDSDEGGSDVEEVAQADDWWDQLADLEDRRAEAEGRMEPDAEGDDEDNDEEEEAAVSPAAGVPPRIPWSEMTLDDLLTASKNPNRMKEMRRDGWEHDPTKFPADEHYPGLYAGAYGPSPEVTAAADSPLGLFLFFMPKDLWRQLAKETNRYFKQNLSARVDRMYERQKEQKKRTRTQILETEARKPDVEPHELLICIGLLIARMMCPHTRHFRDHWATTSVGAVPAGTFGQYMSRNRFAHVMMNLHFTNNADSRSATDRAWKVRSVVDSLQRTFRSGYLTPPVLAFDKAMIPSRSRYNQIRQFMKDKPHKWGTKVFMTCCATTAYCVRLEIYCGQAQHADEVGPSAISVDPNTGPAAVVRNLEAVLPPQEEGVYHAVVTDRFYTSVQLAVQLLPRGVYSIGTIQSVRQGYSDHVTEKRRDRPRSIAHGTTRIAISKACPHMTSMVWWDKKPVQLLCTGGSRAMETCERRQPGGRKAVVPCPSMMRDYQRWMGGVDIHDQLRLQRYSLQLAMVFKKYYKAVFLGLSDIAIVNSFIVHRELRKRADETPPTHSKFLTELQAQLIKMTAKDFEEEDRMPGAGVPQAILRPIAATHEPAEVPEFVVVAGVKKHPQRQCKVCSNRKTRVGKRQGTKYFCPGCTTNDKARTYLCNRVWPHYPGNVLTCHQIWHYLWDNGNKRPKPRAGRDIQMRVAGKKKRKRGEAESEAGDEDGNSDDNEE